MQVKPARDSPLVEGSRDTRHLLPLAAEYEKQAANNNGSDARPNGEVDRLLLLDRKFDRPNFDGRIFLCVRKAAIDKDEDASDE